MTTDQPAQLSPEHLAQYGPPPPGLCGVPEIARWLGLPATNLYKKLSRAEARDDELPPHVVDPATGRRRYHPEAFPAWLSSQPSGPGRPPTRSGA